ncbi:MAG: DUF2207 domain-containing protein, partial [Chloroflexi bacterium]|nr:DUF2207 domain-containing protein [Chloroflexota bacterium]
MRQLRVFLPLTFLFALLALFIMPAEAQSRSVTVPRRDIEIQIQPNGDVNFNETWQVQFSGSPPFTFAFRGILLQRVDSITNFLVSEGGRAYSQSSSESANTFRVYAEEGQQFVRWYFPPTTNQTRTFNLQYTLRGALRIYDGGDQLWWKVIEEDRAYTIQNSTTTVRLPAEFPTDQILAAVTTGKGEASIRDGKTIVFISSNLTPAQELEIRVQFPHGVVTASAPSWQNLEDNKPIFDLGFLFISIIIAVLGPLLLYLLWYVKGRDPATAQIAQTSKPPTDLPPALAGALIDERAELKEIIATLVDLARRGVLKMVEKPVQGILGIGGGFDFAFQRTGSAENLRGYERTLLDQLFGNDSSTDLSDLREKFYTAIPDLQKQIYAEAVKQGYFPGNPSSTRRIYAGLGCGALVIAGACGFLISAALADVSNLALCPAFALGISAIGLIVLSPFMPRRTPKGATESAKWLAFKRYLESIEKFTKLDQAKELFDQYLPYAIAFGLERSYVSKFAQVGTPAPAWYETPYYPGMGFPSRRGFAGDTGDQMSGGGSAGGGASSQRGSSLDQMAGGAFRGLDSMTTGFFAMLNTTASTFTSTPSSSGSSGGGGFSGGGGGGGG